MRILALVPARGGSRRLPGKNVRVLGGLPLIAWTLRAARDSGACAEVLVSTDDEAIAEVARGHGASVPWLRPAELATDTAGSVDVALHALDAHEREHRPVDGLLLLQPTSPFRRPQTIRAAVALFAADGGARPVVSVSPAPVHPAWCFRPDGDGVAPMLGWEALKGRSQDLGPAWALNGALYLVSPRQLRERRAFVAPDMRPLVIEDPVESLDIDTPFDWRVAEAALA